MNVKAVKPHEIPVRLLKQKKMWDLGLFCKLAVTATNWLAYTIADDEDSEPWGAVILEDNPLSYSMVCQTVIVDKPLRTKERVAYATLMAYALVVEAARARGRKYASVGVDDPEKFLKILGDSPKLEVVESVIREEV